MVTRLIARPPKELDSHQDRKFRELLIRLNVDFGAVANLTLVTFSASPSLPNSRRIVGSSDITITDGGAGSTLTLLLNDTGIIAGTYNSITFDAKGRAISGSNLAYALLSAANTWALDQSVPDEVYGAGWNGSLEVPTKNALYDKIEAIVSGGYTDEQAQDAIGAMIDSSLFYTDATPLFGINLNNPNVWTADQSVPDEAYGVGWNGSVEVPTKNALYDKIESLTGGSFSMTETEIDFGTTPVGGKTFTVVDGTVTGASKISAWPSGNLATDRVGNDDEWDMITYSVRAEAGQFILTAMAMPGPVVGKRKVYYAVA